MKMTRYMAGVVLGLLAFCSVATAEVITKDLYLDAAYVQAQDSCDHAIAASASSVMVGTQVQDLARSTWRMRSDMRVASAGLVFDRTGDSLVVQRLVPS